jgi:hypothetical protein
VTDATANAAFDLQVFQCGALNAIWAADQETKKTKGEMRRAIDLVGRPRRGRFKAEVREMTPASVGQKPGVAPLRQIHAGGRLVGSSERTRPIIWDCCGGLLPTALSLKQQTPLSLKQQTPSRQRDPRQDRQ